MYIYWWDKFNLQKPEFLNNSIVNEKDLSVLTKKITGVDIEYKLGLSNNVPMWTNFDELNRIYFNKDCEQIKTMIYHEVAHLITLPQIIPLFELNLKSFFIKAEFLAEKQSIKTAELNNDKTAIIDLINITVIDHIVLENFNRNEHYYARNLLLKDEEYLKIAKKYVDLNKLIEYSYIWKDFYENGKN